MGLVLADPKYSTLPVAGEDWPAPTEEEVATADGPRYYRPQGDAVRSLTADAIKLYDAPVVDAGSEEDLDKGAIHLPETPMPWHEKDQKNVYLAGHRLGRPDTTGRMIFYSLDKPRAVTRWYS